MCASTRDTGECDRRCSTNNSVRISKLQQPQAKLESLVDIYSNAYRDYPEYGDEHAYSYLKSLWEESNPDVLIAENKGEIKGFIVVDPCYKVRNGEPIGEIHEFAVDYATRGLKIGSTLLEAGIKYLSDKGLQKIGLWVGNYNKPAWSLYKKYGFKKQFSETIWTKMERSETRPENTANRKVITRRIQNIENREHSKVAL